MEAEKIICEVRPSQLLNLKTYIISLFVLILIAAAYILTAEKLVLALAAVPILYMYWKFLQVYNMKIKITDERLIITEGVFNKETNETELYRVRDSTIQEPFFYRIFGLGNVVVYTTDDANKTLDLKAYKKPHTIKDHIRNNAEICRQKKRWGNDNVLLHDHIV